MFKIETHLHTKESSPCGWISAAEQVRQYKEHGFDTVFITDHFADKCLSSFGASWEEKVEQFLNGYRLAKEAGDQLGVTVLLSAEYMLNDSCNHYLVYGITEEFLFAHPHIFEQNIADLHALTKANGMLLIQAHPFRGACFPTPEHVDGLEVRNKNIRHFKDEDEGKALEIASAHHLLITAGSDAHRPEDVAVGGIASPFPVASAEEYIWLLKSQQGVLL